MHNKIMRNDFISTYNGTDWMKWSKRDPIYMQNVCPLACDNSKPTKKHTYSFELIADRMGNMWFKCGLDKCAINQVTMSMPICSVCSDQSSVYDEYAVEARLSRNSALILFLLGERKMTNDKCFFFCMIYSNSTLLVSTLLEDWLQLEKERERERCQENRKSVLHLPGSEECFCDFIILWRFHPWRCRL